MSVVALLHSMGVSPQAWQGGGLAVHSPIDGNVIALVHAMPVPQVAQAVELAQAAFLRWRQVPAPQRGELVRLLGETLRTHKQALGELITLEVGKIRSEGEGEVQEMIDICDFAVGLSRQLHGLTIASERPGHRMMETWQPLGVVGVITAFNFPVAVWAWNAVLALVCGDAVVWKPSEKAPLCALAVQALFERSCQRYARPEATRDLLQLVIGRAEVGQAVAADARVALVSATGSARMGCRVGQVVASRLGRSLLELGGNNAIIITSSAEMDLALRGVVFSAVGTAGQRCTSARRLLVHASIYDDFLALLKHAYASFSERVAHERYPNAYYVCAALVALPVQTELVRQETFAPILYVLPYDTLAQAIALNNDVPQGLSSAIFTTDLREAEVFMSATGSDCGMANVNIGTSGAEIGGAFGGEKETGGGRESGSDAWKAYMRRATNTVNYSNTLPLAQGVCFWSKQGDNS